MPGICVTYKQTNRDLISRIATWLWRESWSDCAPAVPHRDWRQMKGSNQAALWQQALGLPVRHSPASMQFGHGSMPTTPHELPALADKQASPYDDKTQRASSRLLKLLLCPSQLELPGLSSSEPSTQQLLGDSVDSCNLLMGRKACLVTTHSTVVHSTQQLRGGNHLRAC